MPGSIVIDKDNKLPNSQNYRFLRKEGIALIQNLSGDSWTDYNTHDPGITLLEAICYALTDLGYRTSFDIQDILAPKKLSADSWQKIFYTARQILPNNPLTLLDYRKLIIDTEGVRNAWIEISDDYEVLMYIEETENPETGRSRYSLTYDSREGEGILKLRGLLKVFVEYEEYILTEKKEDEVAKIIWDKLQFHRNLCEDFIGVTSVEYEEFTINALIQVSEGTDIEMITAQIYEVIYDFFSPPVRFYSLEQMLEKNSSGDEIFKGPVLKYGFIDSKELEESKRDREIHLSDIIRLITGVEGVIAVKKFTFGESESAFADFTEWINDIKDNRKTPRLNIENSVINFVRSGDRHRSDNKTPDKERIKAIFSFLQSGNFGSRLKGVSKKDFPVPAGEFMNISGYYPFQNSLPIVYGLKEKFIDADIDEISVSKAISELLDEKIGVNLRIVIDRLSDEASDKNEIKKAITDLLKDSNDVQSQEIIHRLFEEKSHHEIVKKIIREIFGEHHVHKPLREWINDQIQNKSQNIKASSKSKILNTLALNTVKKPLTEIDNKKEITALEEAYKRYQIDKLSKQKKQTLQLKGFLMVFEQIMADYLSQLAHVREIFSFDALSHQTSFPQIVQGVEDMEALFVDFKKFKEEQLKMIETENRHIGKRNKMLDHLLSRFSESMEKYSFFLNQFLGEKAGKKLIEDKVAFLSDYVQISGYRGKGFDYTNTENTWGTDNVEGIKKRICRLLGIENFNRRTIAPEDIYIEQVSPAAGITRYVVVLKNPANREHTLLRSAELEFENEANEILKYILEYGINNDLYEKNRRKDHWVYELKRITQEGDYEPIAHSVHYEHEHERDKALEETLKTLNAFSDDENFHVIEHILLRPKIGPRQEITKRASDIEADIVDFLSIRSVPDKKISSDNEKPEIAYKFKITHTRNENKAIWRLSLLKDTNEVLAVNEDFVFYRHLTRRIEQIKNFGSDYSNYLIGQNADGYFVFRLMAGDRYLGESKKGFRKKEEIESEIASLINFFSYELNFKETGDDDFSYYADPYSLQISIIVPTWHKRFRNPAFMHLFEKTVYLEVPSHIYPHIYWLDHKEMKEFEEAYKLWLDELPNIELPDTDVVNKMIFVLNELRK